MNIGFYNHHKVNNNMFKDPSSSIGENLMYPFFYLGQQLQSMGHYANIAALESVTTYDALTFVEFPGRNNAFFKKALKKGTKNRYLILLESPIIKPDNYDVKNHAYFKKIFTWDDTLVDNKKYFKIQYAHQIPEQIQFTSDTNKKLCTIIASNKGGRQAHELYSERRKAIRWFEKYHPEDFDLYGKNWDRFNFSDTFLGIKLARLNRLTFLTKLLSSYYPSYRGPIASKKATYQKYAFSICYENVEGVTGYITEKIFDCFLAGCVPVYLGAPNITQFIPQNTFIDKKKFPNYEALYDYLKYMPEQEYAAYVQNIRQFLTGPQAKPFSAQYFADTIIKEIV